MISSEVDNLRINALKLINSIKDDLDVCQKEILNYSYAISDPSSVQLESWAKVERNFLELQDLLNKNSYSLIVKTIKIPDHIQKAIAANLERGRNEQS